MRTSLELGENIPGNCGGKHRKLFSKWRKNSCLEFKDLLCMQRQATAHATKKAENISKTATIPSLLLWALCLSLNCCQNFWADWWAQLRWHCAHTDTWQSILCREGNVTVLSNRLFRTMLSQRTVMNKLIPWLKGTNKVLVTSIFQKYYFKNPSFSPVWN